MGLSRPTLAQQEFIMAMADGRHMLPVKVEIPRAIGKEVGKTEKVVLDKRLGNQ